MKRTTSVQRILTMAATVVVGVALVGVSGPSAGAAVEPTVFPSASTVSVAEVVTPQAVVVDSSLVVVSQLDPVREGQPIVWGIHTSLTVKVPDAAPHQRVKFQLSQPGSGLSYRDSTVVINRHVSVSYRQAFPSLAQAKAALPDFLGPATLEVYLTPDGAPILMEVTQWQAIQAMMLRNVTMRRTGSTLTFTGVLVNSAGRPVRNILIRPVEYKGDMGDSTGLGQRTNAKGRFRVESKPTRPGNVGVYAVIESPGGFGTITAYSNIFRYRP